MRGRRGDLAVRFQGAKNTPRISTLFFFRVELGIAWYERDSHVWIQAVCCKGVFLRGEKAGRQTWCNEMSSCSASCCTATVARQFKQIESDDPSIFGRWGCSAEACSAMMVSSGSLCLLLMDGCFRERVASGHRNLPQVLTCGCCSKVSGFAQRSSRAGLDFRASAFSCSLMVASRSFIREIDSPQVLKVSVV